MPAWKGRMQDQPRTLTSRRSGRTRSCAQSPRIRGGDESKGIQHLRGRAPGYVEERDKILNELNDVAKESSYAVRMNQLGIGIVPIRAGKAISQEEYDALPASTKKKFEQSRETVRTALDKAGKQVNELEANTL